MRIRPITSSACGSSTTACRRTCRSTMATMCFAPSSTTSRLCPSRAAKGGLIDRGLARIPQGAFDARCVVNREQGEGRGAGAEEAMPGPGRDRNRIEGLERDALFALDLDRARAGQHDDHLVAI